MSGPGRWRRPAHRALYNSERVSAAVLSIEPVSTGSNPDWIFTADLGGDVTARVPLKLYADASGTLPHAPSPAAAEKPELSANDRATRLAAVALAWNVFQHFYPYFDVVDTDWPRALATALTSAATDADERAFVDTLRRLMAALNDGHGHVFHSRLIDRSHALPLVWAWAEGRLVISHVLDEAAAAGLAPGDVVLGIDGRADRGGGLARPRAHLESPRRRTCATASPSFFRLGRPARSCASRSGAGAACRARSCCPQRQARGDRRAAPGDGRRARARHQLFRYRPGDRERSCAALPQLAEAKAVIFDLRAIPRWSRSLRFLSAESAQSPDLASPDRHQAGSPRRRRIRHQRPLGGAGLAPRIKGRVIFLTDGRAISYAETVMGIVEDYKLADIVGRADRRHQRQHQPLHAARRLPAVTGPA